MTDTKDKHDPELFQIEVVHCKKDPDSIYIGRGSVLGNPYPMQSEADRDRVCDEYEEYFIDRYKKKDPEFMDELCRLVEVAYVQGYIRLGCFCAPRRCHGDTVKKFLNKVLNPPC